ncbi:unnamed protein product [Linum tenue]|uniref:ZF-HD dimerization-type domain-containing protein n=1 Tax=Linum tenue TaxID=586396 RepID=A0AAV0HTJ2_9ROSI|nr:unnamed protein product [Linum tenue]
MGSSPDDALMCTSCGCHRTFDSRWCPRERSTTRESATAPISTACHC